TDGAAAVNASGSKLDMVSVFTTQSSSIVPIGARYAACRVSLLIAPEVGATIGVVSHSAIVWSKLAVSDEISTFTFGLTPLVPGVVNFKNASLPAASGVQTVLP